MFRSIILTTLASALAEMVPFIVGGQMASIDDWPFIAFLSIAGKGIDAACGGSLISSQTILTAAHCVDDILEGKRERFGMFEFRIYMGSSRYESSNMQRLVVDYHSHEEYSFMNAEFDISVLFLSQKVKFSETVKKSILVRRNDFEQSVLARLGLLEVAGWGAVKGPDLRNLEEGRLKRLAQVMYDKDLCRSFMKETGVKKGVICAGINASQFAYAGDSGGPLVRKSDRYQIGIVSIGMDTGIILYTSVPYYFNWIRKAQRTLFDINCFSISTNH